MKKKGNKSIWPHSNWRESGKEKETRREKKRRGTREKETRNEGPEEERR